MHTRAVLLNAPGELGLADVAVKPPSRTEVVVETLFSGVSTGTEKLLWSGRMPHFPGMGYPLVPGYETVGEVVEAGPDSRRKVGETVFLPGASCYADVRGLFGGAAARPVVEGARVAPIDSAFGVDAVSFALAATARHAIAYPRADLPELIVGHGALGRLLARLTLVAGGAPTVWETDARRREGDFGYPVLDPEDDPRRDYRAVYEASGDAGLIDALVGRLAPGGEICLAGFYSDRVGFAFPPAFMKEARLRVSAEWKPEDMLAVRLLAESGSLDLSGLVSHRRPADSAAAAYEAAFNDPDCLKMTLDWRSVA